MKKPINKTLLVLCILIYVIQNSFAQNPAILPVTKNKFIVIAHRGDHTKNPENTLAAFKAAIKSGADYVEVDLRTSKDGHLVVMHDATVDRTTNGKGKVQDLTWEELKMLQVLNGTKKAHKIPLFSEVLKLCKKKINIYLDFKEADVKTAWQEIKNAGMEGQVVVYLNKTSQYKQWRSVASEVPLMTSLIGGVNTAEQLKMLLGQAKLEVLDNVTDPAMIKVAHENGVSVWLDVQNASEGPDSWRQALERGVQGVQTDKPGELVQYLKKNGLRDGTAATLVEPVKKRSSYIELKNVKYGDAPGDENLLDAYVPKDHTDATKLIVYMHGGSWSRGDKGEFPKVLIDELVEKQGYAVVSINYRLVKEGKDLFPAQIEDVKKALNFLSSKASKYHYDGNQFALMGGSAGAHLAMLYAYGHDDKKQVKSVIDLWGPTDLTDKNVRQEGSDANNIVIRFLGEKDTQAQITKDASPTYFLTKDTGKPTILFHGGQDPLVHVSQAENLYAKLQLLEIPSQLEIYPNEKHGVGAAELVDVMEKMVKWLDKTYPAK